MGNERRQDAETQAIRDRAANQPAPTMRAVVQHRYGPPSVLEVSELGLPLPRRGDVLVQV